MIGAGPAGGVLSGGMYGSAAGLTNPAGWAVTGLQLAGKILGGSGKTSSVLQGFRVRGTVGESGFSGNIEAFDQKGNRWDATGEAAWINSLGPRIFEYPELGDFFKGGLSLPFELDLPADNNLIQGAVQSTIRNFVETERMNAPNFSGSLGNVATAQASPQGTASAAAPQSNQAPNVAPASLVVSRAFAGLDQIMLIVAAVGALLFVLKKG